MPAAAAHWAAPPAPVVPVAHAAQPPFSAIAPVVAFASPATHVESAHWAAAPAPHFPAAHLAQLPFSAVAPAVGFDSPATQVDAVHWFAVADAKYPAGQAAAQAVAPGALLVVPVHAEQVVAFAALKVPVAQSAHWASAPAPNCPAGQSVQFPFVKIASKVLFSIPASQVEAAHVPPDAAQLPTVHAFYVKLINIADKIILAFIFKFYKWIYTK
jgi:hypothetical protein